MAKKGKGKNKVKATEVVIKTQVAKTTKKSKKNKGKGKKGMRASMSHNMERICSLVDPFCPSAFGAKLQDAWSARTSTYQVRVIGSITTNAGGATSFLLAPDPSEYLVGLSTGAGTTLTIPGNLTAPDTAFTSSVFAKARVVSAGFHYIPVLASSTASGTAIVTEIEDTNFVLGSGYVCPDFKVGTALAIRNIRDEFCNNCRPMNPDADKFQAFQGAGVRTSCWSGLYFQFNGPVSTTIGSYEVIVNFECTNAPDSVYQSSMSNSYRTVPIPKSNDLAIQEIRRGTASITASGTKGGPESFGAMVSNVAMDLINQYGPSAAGMAMQVYTGNPIAAGVAYSATESYLKNFGGSGRNRNIRMLD